MPTKNLHFDSTTRKKKKVLESMSLYISFQYYFHKDEYLAHRPWPLTRVTAPFFLQSTEAGTAETLVEITYGP